MTRCPGVLDLSDRGEGSVRCGLDDGHEGMHRGQAPGDGGLWLWGVLSGKHIRYLAGWV